MLREVTEIGREKSKRDEQGRARNGQKGQIDAQRKGENARAWVRGKGRNKKRSAGPVSQVRSTGTEEGRRTGAGKVSRNERRFVTSSPSMKKSNAVGKAGASLRRCRLAGSVANSEGHV